MAVEDRAYAEEQKEKSTELFKGFRLNFKGISETQISAIKQIGAELRAEQEAEERAEQRVERAEAGERDYEENIGTLFTNFVLIITSGLALFLF